jgi:8-oxo-dGTP diphosphatase
MLTVKAIVRQGDKILALKRPPNKLYPRTWDFPGGKADPGEALEDCIKRETWEETRLHITSLELFDKSTFQHQGEEVTVIVYIALAEGNVQISQEHTEFLWALPEELEEAHLSPMIIHATKKLQSER